MAVRPPRRLDEQLARADGEKLRLGIERVLATQGGLSNGRVRKRNTQVIRPPRMFVTDVASCAWLTQQLEADKTVLMIDEPTMGADQGNGEALPPGRSRA